jgi:hypothetical protein
MRMPFGKHKGEALEDIDEGYLRWIAENVTSDTALVNEAEKQLVLREGRGVVRSGDGRTQMTGDE